MKQSFSHRKCVLLAVRLSSVTMLASCSGLSDNSAPDVDIDKEVTSPDKKTVATFYTVSGGGAAGYLYMRVALRSSEEKFKAGDNYVFEMGHAYNLDFQWKTNRVLTIIYPTNADVHRKLYFYRNTKIIYQVK